MSKEYGPLRLSIFIHVDVLVLISEFVVVAIFQSGGPYRRLPTTVGASLERIFTICDRACDN